MKFRVFDMQIVSLLPHDDQAGFMFALGIGRVSTKIVTDPRQVHWVAKLSNWHPGSEDFSREHITLLP